MIVTSDSVKGYLAQDDGREQMKECVREREVMVLVMLRPVARSMIGCRLSSRKRHGFRS